MSSVSSNSTSFSSFMNASQNSDDDHNLTFVSRFTADIQQIAEHSEQVMDRALQTEVFEKPREFNVCSDETQNPIKLRFSLKEYVQLYQQAVRLGNRHVEIRKSSVKDGIAKFELIACPFQGLTETDRKTAEHEWQKGDLFSDSANMRFADFLNDIEGDEQGAESADRSSDPSVQTESTVGQDQAEDDKCCPTSVDLADVYNNVSKYIPHELLKSGAVDLSVYEAKNFATLSNVEILDLLELTVSLPMFYLGLLDLRLRLYDAFRIPADFLKLELQNWQKFNAALVSNDDFMNAVVKWPELNLEKRVQVMNEFVGCYATCYGIRKPVVELGGTPSRFGSYSHIDHKLHLQPELLGLMDVMGVMASVFHEMTHAWQNSLMQPEMSTVEGGQCEELARLFQVNRDSYVVPIYAIENVDYHYRRQPVEAHAYANEHRWGRFFQTTLLAGLKDASQADLIKASYQALESFARMLMGEDHPKMTDSQERARQMANYVLQIDRLFNGRFSEEFSKDEDEPETDHIEYLTDQFIEVMAFGTLPEQFLANDARWLGLPQ